MSLRIESGAAPEPFDECGRSARDRPDTDPVSPSAERWIAWRGADPVARLSAMRAEGLVGAPGTSGMVGHYEALDAEAGAALLRAAAAALAGQGARRVLGPINGSTWRRYRLALPLESGDARFQPPVFLSEPDNPPAYPSHFVAAGFAVAARYESRIEAPIGVTVEAQRQRWAPLGGAGLTLRTLEPARLREELLAFWQLSLAAFQNNPYYSPIGYEEFLALYEPIRGRIDPDLVLLAHDGSARLVGYMLGFADPMSPKRLVCKTVAVHPELRGRRLGSFLLAEVRHRGAARGMTAAIDALIEAGNVSRSMSMAHGSQVFKRYALYEWRP